MNCITCHKQVISGTFIHTPQKRIICKECKEKSELKQAEIIRK